MIWVIVNSYVTNCQKGNFHYNPHVLLVKFPWIFISWKSTSYCQFAGRQINQRVNHHKISLNMISWYFRWFYDESPWLSTCFLVTAHSSIHRIMKSSKIPCNHREITMRAPIVKSPLNIPCFFRLFHHFWAINHHEKIWKSHEFVFLFSPFLGTISPKYPQLPGRSCSTSRDKVCGFPTVICRGTAK